eukprot:CAMPEP_0203819300 /NCGR_PEP_ID=MMETSP0115-20131106/35020_1 /ASSEMBLY_ACC=CAM_ASM_000227 /TAXON_ID=33651 /ORGANISM="Bicosoecid sp, Strain ms1" /LENGTH=137 /DNA_ID=CAMNT_0050728279 /DNA_START=177 /DNA_END=590 /DNA_ORIENTATION=+
MPSSFASQNTWHPSRDVSVSPSAKSSMSSSSSSGSSSCSYTLCSRMTWQVEQAISPPQAPSMSMSCSCATSSNESPTLAATSRSAPSGSTNFTEIDSAEKHRSGVATAHLDADVAAARGAARHAPAAPHARAAPTTR